VEDVTDAEEASRARGLLIAQARAAELFALVGARGLVAAGESEDAVSDRIRDLANEMFGTTHRWHKRIVRSGPNTLFPYQENAPDRTIGADDIALADFGPVFEEPDDFAADFGRTFVLGDDPVKHRLRNDLRRVFANGRRFFEAAPDITGRALYEEIARHANEVGWELGGWHAGHLVGERPHESVEGADAASYVALANETPLRRTDREGRRRHWILEVHLVDRARGFGGFYEQLLDLTGTVAGQGTAAGQSPSGG
jgi:hypothetical protein